jgi:hypothetical protein
LLNTGACVGAMTLLVTNGRLLPKFIPSFTWYLNDTISEGSGKASLYATARSAMGRRKRPWTEADEAMWNTVYEITAEEREKAIERSKRQSGGK